MENEMIERASAAVCEAHHQWELENNRFGSDVIWSASHCALLVRTVLLAIREPTEAMVRATGPAFAEINDLIVFSHARGSHRGGIKKDPVPDAYRAMIDTALKPPEPNAASPLSEDPLPEGRRALLIVESLWESGRADGGVEASHQP